MRSNVHLVCQQTSAFRDRRCEINGRPLPTDHHHDTRLAWELQIISILPTLAGQSICRRVVWQDGRVVSLLHVNVVNVRFDVHPCAIGLRSA